MGDDSLGRMIKRGRDSLGFSQARLGELVGRSASTIRNWEREKSAPSALEDAVALAAVLGLDERRVVEAAGFEPADAGTHQTVEQAYASLAPQGPDPEEAEPDGATPPPATPEVEEVASDFGDTAEEDAAEDAAQGPEEEPAAAEAAAATGPAVLDPARVEPSVEEPPEDDEGDNGDEGSRDDDEADTEGATPPPEDDEPSGASATPAPSPGRRLSAVARPPTAEPGPGEDPDVGRAAPPTVLEANPAAEPSYVEDPAERQRYRVRAMATAAVIIALFVVLVWSFDRATDALGTMWDEFMGMLEL